MACDLLMCVRMACQAQLHALFTVFRARLLCVHSGALLVWMLKHERVSLHVRPRARLSLLLLLPRKKLFPPPPPR
jgi:hypothetical protein